MAYFNIQRDKTHCSTFVEQQMLNRLSPALNLFEHPDTARKAVHVSRYKGSKGNSLQFIARDCTLRA